MRNPNLALLLSTALMLGGCWIAGWDVDEDEAFWIVMVSFWSGFALLMFLDDRFPDEGLLAARRRRR